MHDELPLDVEIPELVELLRSGERLMLLDCRTPEEHAIARIEPARLIPMDELPDRLGELPEDHSERIVVFCHHGGRSSRVAQWLRAQGYAAQSLAGGIDAWSEQVDPTIPRY